MQLFRDVVELHWSPVFAHGNHATSSEANALKAHTTAAVGRPSLQSTALNATPVAPCDQLRRHLGCETGYFYMCLRDTAYQARPPFSFFTILSPDLDSKALGGNAGSSTKVLVFSKI